MRRGWLAVMVVLVAGCRAAPTAADFDFPDADVFGADATVGVDAAGGSDGEAGPDVVVEANDSSADAADVTVAVDILDTSDAEDVPQSPDSLDVTDTANIPDWEVFSDVADASDAEYMPDILDVTSAADTTDAPTDATDITPDIIAAECGNGTCGAGETCENCAVDCPCKPCNPLTSVGCAKSQQCYVTNTGLACGGFGTVADGGLCTNLNDCAVGSMCIGGLCRKICATAGSSLGCTAPAVCEELANGTTSLGYNLGTCADPSKCNLITNGGCPTNTACMPSASGKQCSPAGTVGLGGTCQVLADCAAGFLCLNNGATPGTCKKRCNTTDATTCPSGLSCGGITIGSPPVLVGENFGICDKP